MCKKERPEIKAVLENLKQPLPFGKKMHLFIRNNVLKIIRMKYLSILVKIFIFLSI